MTQRIGRQALLDLFERLDDALGQPQMLCVIGAAAVLCHGSTERQTEDIDIWRPASTLNDRVLRPAARCIGVEYNPESLETPGLYLQILSPGLVQLPEFDGETWSTGETSEILWTGNKLTVTSPPVSIVIAAKLARANDRDIDDSVFLIGAKKVNEDAIRRAISKVADRSIRETALDNMVLLQVVLDRSKRIAMAKDGRPENDERQGNQ